MKNRLASLINRNNRRIGRVLWSILRREIVSCSFRIYFLLVWKGRKSDWGEICVDARSSVVFCVVSSPPRSRIVPRYQIACASLIANLFIYYFFFFIRELTTKSFARIEENMWRTLDRIIIFSSFMFIRRRIRCNLSSLLSSRKISSTPRSSSFDRRVRNSNWTAVAGTIFNETSVTFAYRDIQFCEAAKNKGSRRRKEAEVAVGGHAIK